MNEKTKKLLGNAVEAELASRKLYTDSQAADALWRAGSSRAEKAYIALREAIEKDGVEGYLTDKEFLDSFDARSCHRLNSSHRGWVHEPTLTFSYELSPSHERMLVDRKHNNKIALLFLHGCCGYAQERQTKAWSLARDAIALAVEPATTKGEKP